jgi:2-polyprenyl-3-methyl-5-hydroxy-6-metoxy-1,4-benzoquinol methylase
MEKYLDRITEAYNGEMGEWMMKKSRERVDWICGKVTGKKILDVGCSQGIVPIILGRGGLEVTGIDIAAESIEYATNCLINEDFATQKNVRFFCSDFLQLSFEENAYDTIVMTEFLEHVDDPGAFLDRTRACLGDNGRVIVTVPFGINDWPDHKRTYYLAEIYELLSRHFFVTDIEFFGKWIGFVADSILTEGQSIVALDLALLQSVEKEFFAIERVLIDSNNNENAKRQKLEALYKQQADKNTVLTQECDQLLKEKDALRLERDRLSNDRNNSLELLVNIMRELQNETNLLVKIRRDLLRLQTQNNYLERENEEYRRKLSKITDTWYGNLALKLYKHLKKIKIKLNSGGK